MTKFDKKKILQRIIEQLSSTLRTIEASAVAAHSEATDPEAKSEHKYDTRGLEASYLAGAQSKRAVEIAKHVQICQNISLKSTSTITWGAIVRLCISIIEQESHETLKGVSQTIIILPIPGGLTIEVNNQTVTAISLESPLGKVLIGCKVGDTVQMKTLNRWKEYAIMDLS